MAGRGLASNEQAERNERNVRGGDHIAAFFVVSDANFSPDSQVTAPLATLDVCC